MAAQTGAKGAGGFHYGYLIVAALILITGIPCATVLSCAGIFFNPVSEFFGVPKTQFTLYFSISNIAMMITLPFAGKMIEQFSARYLFSANILLAGLCLVAMSFFNAVWQFYIAGALLGISMAFLVFLSVPVMINRWFKTRVGFFIGLCMAFTGIGAVLFNPIGTHFITSAPEGWRTAYLVYGVCILLLSLPFCFFVLRDFPSDKGLLPYGAESNSTEDAGTEIKEVGIDANKALKTSAFFAVLCFGLFISLNQTVYQFIPGFLQSMDATVPGMAALSGVAASACMGGMAIGKIVLGIINDKSVRAALFTCLGLGIIGILVMILFPTSSMFIMVGSFLFGWAYAGTTVQTPMLTRSVFGNRDYTLIYSRISVAVSLASAVAAILWALIIDLSGSYQLLFFLSIACMVICLLSGLYAVQQSTKLRKEFN